MVTRMSAPAPVRASVTMLSRSSLAMPRLTASPPCACDQRREPIAHRGDDLIGAELGARRHDLIAGGENGDRRLAASPAARHGWRTPPASAPRGPSLVPRLSSTSTVVEVLPARADVAARRRLFHDDLAVALFGILLDDDGVGAVRHRRAGKDAHRLALSRAYRQIWRRPRLRRSGPASRGARPHRRRGPRSRPWPRHRRAAGSASRQGPRPARAHRHPRWRPARPRAEQARSARGRGPHRRKEAPSVYGARKWPERPPVFSIRRMPENVMARSTALHMS